MYNRNVFVIFWRPTAPRTCKPDDMRGTADGRVDRPYIGTSAFGTGRCGIAPYNAAANITHTIQTVGKADTTVVICSLLSVHCYLLKAAAKIGSGFEVLSGC